MNTEFRLFTCRNKISLKPFKNLRLQHLKGWPGSRKSTGSGSDKCRAAHELRRKQLFPIETDRGALSARL
jgi:hypothetical protein